MRRFGIAFTCLLACSGQPEPTETVATLPTPPAATAKVAPRTEGWPCVMPPIITEHQAATLEQMTKSGRPDLVEQAADIRARICAGWAARNAAP